MEIIKKLSEQIDEELGDASKYIKCALNMKEEEPDVAKLYYTLSLEEMKHATMLHDEVKKIIAAYKVKMGEPPKEMMFLYNYLHDKQIDRASKIKAKQDSFK